MHAKYAVVCNGLFTLNEIGGILVGLCMPMGQAAVSSNSIFIYLLFQLWSLRRLAKADVCRQQVVLRRKNSIVRVRLCKTLDRSRSGSVGITAELRVRGSWVRNPVWSRVSSLSANRSHRLCSPSSLLLSVYLGVNLTTILQLLPRLRTITCVHLHLLLL